jgi:hypothetical protein
MKKKTSLKAVVETYKAPAMTPKDVAPVTNKPSLERMTFFVSKEEQQRLKIDAVKAGMTVSNYIRSMIFGKAV